MDNNYYIYAHSNPITGEVFYIGKGKDGRARSTHRRSVRWHNYVNKYGYKISLIENGLTQEKAFQKEIEYIKLYGRVDFKAGSLINMSDGGAGGNNNKGRKLSEEWKRKIALAGKGKIGHMRGKTWSEEHKINLSLKMKGRPALHLIGKKQSIEHVRKVADQNIGRKHSVESKKKMSLKLKGQKRTPEQIENNRKAQLSLPKYKCPYCPIVVARGNFNRYHGEKCKHK